MLDISEPLSALTLGGPPPAAAATKSKWAMARPASIVTDGCDLVVVDAQAGSKSMQSSPAGLKSSPPTSPFRVAKDGRVWTPPPDRFTDPEVLFHAVQQEIQRQRALHLRFHKSATATDLPRYSLARRDYSELGEQQRRFHSPPPPSPLVPPASTTKAAGGGFKSFSPAPPSPKLDSYAKMSKSCSTTPLTRASYKGFGVPASSPRKMADLAKSPPSRPPFRKAFSKLEAQLSPSASANSSPSSATSPPRMPTTPVAMPRRPALEGLQEHSPSPISDSLRGDLLSPPSPSWRRPSPRSSCSSPLAYSSSLSSSSSSSWRASKRSDHAALAVLPSDPWED